MHSVIRGGMHKARALLCLFVATYILLSTSHNLHVRNYLSMT